MQPESQKVSTQSFYSKLTIFFPCFVSLGVSESLWDQEKTAARATKEEILSCLDRMTKGALMPSTTNRRFVLVLWHGSVR